MGLPFGAAFDNDRSGSQDDGVVTVDELRERWVADSRADEFDDF